MKVSVYEQNALPKDLSTRIFEARSRQFIERLGWNLSVDAHGGEKDRYDDESAWYLAVESGKRHLLSCRLRPVSSGTMIEECFDKSFPDAGRLLTWQRNNLWELTRFCRSPDITVYESTEALRAMSYALDATRDNIGISGFVAVVYPHFVRFLRRIGTRYLKLGEGMIEGHRSYLICITHAVDCRNWQRVKKKDCRISGISPHIIGQLAA